MKFDQTATGSGALIGGNLVLTCAHNCYDHKTKQKAEKISFYPANNGKNGKEVKVKAYHYMKEFESNNNY